MATVTINVTILGFNVKVTSSGELIEAPQLSIGGYVRKFQNYQYDQALRQRVLSGEYFWFDQHRKVCYFPRYDLENFKAFLTDNNINVDVVIDPPTQGKAISFEMQSWVDYKNDLQKAAVEYLISPASGAQRPLALQTGAGKSVATIWSLQKMGVRSLITMTSRLTQWLSEFKKYSTLDEDDIYIVQGEASLTKLFSQIDKTIKAKVILFSTQTMKRYLNYGPNYQHLPHPSKMCELLGVGIVGTDEYHEHFFTNYLIGLILNPAIFIPITATFTTSDQFAKQIFDKFVPVDSRFTGGDYNKFVDVTSYVYRSGGYYIQPYAYQSPRGYSQQMFEKWLLRRGRKFLESMEQGGLIPIIRDHYINIAEEGEKLLFLCASTALCDHLVNVFARAFNSKTVTAFYSGIPESVLKTYDIILSTPGSSGTGRDIKNLRTCFVFESVDSETRNLQFIGRLRGPPQMMNTPEYVYIAISSIPAHMRVHQKRAMLLGARAKTFKHRNIGG